MFIAQSDAETGSSSVLSGLLREGFKGPLFLPVHSCNKPLCYAKTRSRYIADSFLHCPNVQTPICDRRCAHNPTGHQASEH